MLVGSILIGADEVIAEYVASKIGPHVRFKDYTSLGVVRNGTLCGGVVYHNYVKHAYGNMIEVSYAFDSARWALPQTLRALLAYPFEQLDCCRLNTIVAKSNARSRRFIEGIGFKLEGTHPKAWDGRQTSLSYGMTRDNCRWIRDQ